MSDGAALPADAVDRYLVALGVRRRPPGREALGELVAAHVTGVPFENVSKLYRLKRLGLAGLPSLDLFLDGIERYRLGGTCYANNCHLCSLLLSLGYEARLCGADMRRRDVHVVIIVTLDGRELLVDGGYGAPFLAPLARDVDVDQVVVWGNERYVLEPRDGAGCSRLELFRDGVRKHGYVVNPAPRVPGHFRDVIADSFLPDATFMNAVALYRFDRHGSLAIRNLQLIETTPDAWTVRALRDTGELAAVAEERFGVPASIVLEAVAGIPRLRDAWS
jgi:arylamine N-acetyltransferase